jgi:hypothetical protein
MIHDYYGDETRWFVGIVKNIQDPLEMGRVQVRIFGVHPDKTIDANDGDLPWAQVIIPVTEGGTSGIGTNIGIKPQSQVYGIFLDGKNSQLPLVLGSIPIYEKPISQDYYNYSSSVPDSLQHEDMVSSDASLRNRYPPDVVDEKYLVGSTNIEKAFNFFLTQEGGGFTPAQAAGIIGNFFVESAANQNGGDLNPIAQSAPPERSFGIAQWNSAESVQRYQGLLEFAALRNLPWQSMYCQLLFTVKELNDSKTYYRLNELKRAKTAAEACSIFEDRFENPKIKGQQERIDAANEIYRKLTT